MRAWLIRLKYRWLIIRNSGAELNRRVDVENWLLNCSVGKQPLPDAKTCRWLALRLGTPKEFWSDALKGAPQDMKI